ncbi:CLUMA_CG020734, isoform A [Clunio marinus]|uniref:CLUMA_CG020734, isoform A n=1 Tax=Clunio marinus TaxID=568069 RepID=A0A1J1J7M8_9DIPT|nr:CLUMA_CG020734, isoform A [Clunio marinus]
MSKFQSKCSFCDESPFTSREKAYYSFPDSRKNPALYVKWCNILNIDAKEEKIKKPLVCRKHFHPYSIVKDTGELKPRSLPRKVCRGAPYKRKTIEDPQDKPLKKEPTEHQIINESTNNVKQNEDQQQPGVTSELERILTQSMPNPKKNSLPSRDEISDDEQFLDSLLPSVRSMNFEQKWYFEKEMFNLLMDG